MPTSPLVTATTTMSTTTTVGLHDAQNGDEQQDVVNFPFENGSEDDASSPVIEDQQVGSCFVWFCTDVTY